MAMDSARQPFQGEELPPMRHTALELMKIAAPTMTANFLQLLNEFTNTLCLGHVGNDAELAAVGLGNMMQNCFGLSIAFGLTTALDTLVSQAHGAGQHQLCIHYLQRSRVIGALQLVWMFPILWFSDDLLIAVGQHKDVAKHACNYNRVAAFGLFFLFQHSNTLAFLRNKNRPNAAAWISGVTSVLHIVWAVLFIVVLNMGNSGAGAANLTTWTLQCLSGAVFLAWNASSLHGSVWQLLGVQKEGFRQWRSYLAIGIPGTLQLCGEWWFWEICALVIGFLGPTPLAAHVATINLVALLFMPSVALSNAAATVVGNSIGELRPKKSRQAAWVAAGMDVIMWTLLALILVTLGKFVVKLLTSNEAVQDITVVLINIYCVAGYFDNVQNVIGGALRGVGINQAPAAVYLICYYLIMLPVSCCFVWPLKLGVYGMWWSMVLGTGMATIALAVLLYRVDWAGKAAESEERRLKDDISTPSTGTSTLTPVDVVWVHHSTQHGARGSSFHDGKLVCWRMLDQSQRLVQRNYRCFNVTLGGHHLAAASQKSGARQIGHVRASHGFM